MTCPCGQPIPQPSRADRRYCSDNCRKFCNPASVARRGGRVERYPPRQQRLGRPKPLRPRNKGVVLGVVRICGLTVLDGPDAGLTVYLDGTVLDGRRRAG